MQKYTVFIGIDMSKEWFDACLLRQEHDESLPQVRLPNQADGFTKLLKWVSRSVGDHPPQSQWYFCMEHTGLYTLPLALFLEELGLTYVLESPLRVHRSMGLKREKSDAADAADIADYAVRNYSKIKVRPLPSGILLQVQQLLSLRARLVRYRQGLSVAEKELKAMTKSSINQLVVQANQPICELMSKQIKALDKTIKELLCSDSELKRLYELIISVVGIGPVCSAYLLVYTNGFTAFEKARQFTCYIGIAPFAHSSGKSIKLPDKVSFLANRRIKALISMAAVSACQHDPHFRRFFKRQLDKGQKEGWIYNAVKNKLLYRVFAVVKRGTPYVVLEQH